ncbi:MAG: GTP-binding protein [Candidatus Heimdallarchaeota archaeon]|nr:GTP-binding protein [Candidatus Heimdallarchaeota archaeon]MCK4290033.1 GTP-binding protein [Candidatus Heimdallarchaeota archaeon]
MPTIGFVGIDNAGKTTIIDVFTKHKITKTIPTVGVNLEQVTFSEIDFHLNILDMGGQKSFRLLWVDYLNTVDIVLYVIDASDHERIDESLKEFQNMLILTEANDIPILVLINKIDLPNTLSALEIGQKFSKIPELNNRDWNIVETSAITTKGLIEMFKWTYSKITNNILVLEVDYTQIADKKYYTPCPLLLSLSDGDYCINHDNFTPVKVVPLLSMFSKDMSDPEQVIKETIEEFENVGRMVCFNSIFVSDEDINIHCATDATVVEVERVTASKDEYIDSYNMMHLTGGKMCSECLYKILFSAIKRKIKAGMGLSLDEIENIKIAEARRPTDPSKC